MTGRNYSRKYLRIKPDNPICAEITIVQVGTKIVKTGVAGVNILNLSPGGLKFISRLNLPVDASVLLELHFKVVEQDFRLKGYIVYKSCVEIHEYEYGFCFFEADETLRIYLKKLFNNMSVKMERHIVILRFN